MIIDLASNQGWLLRVMTSMTADGASDERTGLSAAG